MSATAMTVGQTADATALRPREERRGQWGMVLFIATEAMLFVLLFFAYFYLASSQPRWPLEEDPSYFYALILLAILLLSSATLHLGQRGLEAGGMLQFRIGLGSTLVLGALFLVVQFFEYRKHLMSLSPLDSAYGSIFYTITSFHLAHVVLGLLMLGFTFAVGLSGHFSRGRTETVRNVAWYWHFVDLIWIVVVSILYLSPQFYGPQ